MSQAQTQQQAQQQAQLQQWHRVVKEKDFELLGSILADNVQFHSPTLWQAKQGKPVTAFILKTVIGIFQDFHYHREFISDNSVALEFSAKVGDKQVKGIDLIRWNDQGEIENFEVMMRPINGVQKMLELMTAELQKAGFLAKDA